MILYPSVDELLKRVDSRYSLIMLAAKRAHEIDQYEADKWKSEHSDKPVDMENDKPYLLDHYESSKSVGKALEEIEAGLVTIDPDETDDEA